MDAKIKDRAAVGVDRASARYVLVVAAIDLDGVETNRRRSLRGISRDLIGDGVSTATYKDISNGEEKVETEGHAIHRRCQAVH